MGGGLKFLLIWSPAAMDGTVPTHIFPLSLWPQTFHGLLVYWFTTRSAGGFVMVWHHPPEKTKSWTYEEFSWTLDGDLVVNQFRPSNSR